MISPGTGEQRVPPVGVNGGADPGVKAHGEDVDRFSPSGINEVHEAFFCFTEVLRVKEQFRPGKLLDEIVAGAARKACYREIIKAISAAYHLVERAVSPTGIETRLVTGFARCPGQLCQMPRIFGYGDLQGFVQCLTQTRCGGGDFCGTVCFSRVGIDEEQIIDDALTNAPALRPVKAYAMPDLMRELVGKEIGDETGIPMIILTNEDKRYGAGVVF